MARDDIDPKLLITDMAIRARAASVMLARETSSRKASALRSAAQAIRTAEAEILTANKLDVETARANGLSAAMLDRLTLDPKRIANIGDGVEAVAGLRDPVGMVIDESLRPNGLKLSRVRVPLGVIGIIFESRPNVTVDAGILCLKSGNAAILRGGSEAIRTNSALHAALIAGIAENGLPADSIQLVHTTDRAAVGAMLAAQGLIDIIIPRGGKTLVARVQDEARVPVLAHLDGICHTYIDAAADPTKAVAIAVNAKMRRTGVCGATETLLIDRAFPNAAEVVRALLEAGCILRGDPEAQGLDSRIEPASEKDWDTEYLDNICAVAMTDGVSGALAHIAAHSSHHTESIVTENVATAEQFLTLADSAIVMHNTSTQFADGGEFGLGAEIGIATGRLHARGPVALEGLTTYKWLVRGTGQVRP